ncbi:2-amino-4-hydroxy-6-hydroxymethyldihydropteridine diphosphokinase [Jatrophihabitans sp.]|uniref:2-amino-4-hydroxy-6- hydroxymethyldihydropteridine diphosphokinase n=1 Tax=Jatrophihabitans sp. TaxID=1932789 RepID=UPI002B622F5F|nr:2-amino-4-hydroxy-6-hydroxymethyldihydropteridine diphosphokinase [Jatrophihabitans sp.]
MSRAVLSIGSNLGDRLAHLRSAVTALAPYLTAASPVFQTPPWGPVEQQPFYNAVLLVDDPQAGPADWLARAQACEQAAGRIREQRWGPRTLDVDVITVDDIRSEDPVLTLPHPRAAERAFVLVPWWSVDPEAQLPGHGSVLQLMQALPAGEVAAVQLLPAVELRP